MENGRKRERTEKNQTTYLFSEIINGEWKDLGLGRTASFGRVLGIPVHRPFEPSAPVRFLQKENRSVLDPFVPAVPMDGWDTKHKDFYFNGHLFAVQFGYNYGVILIPEGLIDFIPKVQHLLAKLNEILAQEVVNEVGLWKKKLTDQSLQLFEFLPEAIQEQLMLERDPHGNVQVAKIETKKMLIQMVETELEKRKQEGAYKGQFKGQSHFFGCGLPTNFDATYCYALGYGTAILLHCGKPGLISSVGNLDAPVEE
ncbi:hypothetical protein L1049_022967 [Liquidambar formosana]|uniref:Uncharacterized protein n=1 Tax=Liquidambar formosana TaxID=63359 RepID=A0AAP0RDC1_LIQFO